MTVKRGVKKRVKAGTSKLSAADKRKAFVEAFLSNGGNATQAAITAGYSESSARRQGYRMTTDVHVLSELDKRRGEIAEKLGLNTERLLREVARVAFSDPRKLVHPDGKVKFLHELDDDTAAAVASVKYTFDGGIEYKLWDKNSAQERGCKITGQFEKDNRQRIDPLRDLLESLSGNVIGVTKLIAEGD